MTVAAFAAGIALAAFLFTAFSFFINLGGTLVDQATQVVVTISGGKAQLHNLSSTPVSDVQIFYGGDLVVITGATFARPGETIAADLTPEQTSVDSLRCRYVGVRGLRWDRYADGRISFQCKPIRGFAIRMMTWPWYHDELKSR